LHLVGDVVGLLDALGEETACVAGHDWGAIIAWSAAILRPDRVKAVMALSVPYTPRGPVSSLAAGRAAFGDGFYHNYFQQPGLAEAEFERDCRTTLRKFLYGASGEVPPSHRLALVIPEGRGMLDQAIDPDVLPPWLTQTDINYYATTFEQTGFTGGLNWYRMIERNWELMAPWHGAAVGVPTLFLAGDRDTVATSSRGQQQLATMQRFVPNLKATVLLPGGGHWIQQERPTEVTTAMLQFLQSL
jgi:pimeloyl-ACP methyl ester carboxylesterase